MKNIMMAGLILGSVVCASALDWQTCLEYKFTNAPAESWELRDDGKGVFVSSWKLTNAIPTKAELQSVEAAAIAWKKDKIAEDRADVAQWKTQPVDGGTLADAFRALVICINTRLPATNQITVAEFKAALKTELKK